MPDIDHHQAGHVIAEAQEIEHGHSRTFVLTCGGKPIEGFVVNFRGKFYAYVNRCCHIPMRMDWVENQFFTRDKRFLICPTHGASYDPTTGLCLDGPCPGEYLESIPVSVKQGQVTVYCPPEWD